MGLREKVALALAAVLTTQIVCSYSMPRGLLNLSTKSHTSSPTSSKIKIARENKSFTADAQTGNYYCFQPNYAIQANSKDTKKTSSRIRDYGNEVKGRRRYRMIPNIKTNPAFTTINEELNRTRQPYCFRKSDFFPEVEYPLSARDTWVPKYWSQLQDAERDHTKIDTCSNPTKITNPSNLENYRSSLSNIINTLNSNNKMFTETVNTDVISEVYITGDGERETKSNKMTSLNSSIATATSTSEPDYIIDILNISEESDGTWLTTLPPTLFIPFDAKTQEVVTSINDTLQTTIASELFSSQLTTRKSPATVPRSVPISTEITTIPMLQDGSSDTTTSAPTPTLSQKRTVPKLQEGFSGASTSAPTPTLSQKTTVPILQDGSSDITTSAPTPTLSPKTTVPMLQNGVSGTTISAATPPLSRKTTVPMLQDGSSGTAASAPTPTLPQKTTVCMLQNELSGTTKSALTPTLSQKTTVPMLQDGPSSTTTSTPTLSLSQKTTKPTFRDEPSGTTTSAPTPTLSQKTTVSMLQDGSSSITSSAPTTTLSQKTTVPMLQEGFYETSTPAPTTTRSQKTTIPMLQEGFSETTTPAPSPTLPQKTTELLQDGSSGVTVSASTPTLLQKTTVPMLQEGFSGISTPAPSPTLPQKTTVLFQDGPSGATTSAPTGTISPKTTLTISQDGSLGTTTSAPTPTLSQKTTVPMLREEFSGTSTPVPSSTLPQKTTVLLQDGSSSATTSAPTSTLSSKTTVPILQDGSSGTITSAPTPTLLRKTTAPMLQEESSGTITSALTPTLSPKTTVPLLQDGFLDTTTSEPTPTLPQKTTMSMLQGGSSSTTVLNSSLDIVNNKKTMTTHNLTQTDKVSLPSSNASTSHENINCSLNFPCNDILLVYADDSSDFSNVYLDILDENLITDANNSYITRESLPEYSDDYIVIIDSQNTLLPGEMLTVTAETKNSSPIKSEFSNVVNSVVPTSNISNHTAFIDETMLQNITRTETLLSKLSEQSLYNNTPLGKIDPNRKTGVGYEYVDTVENGLDYWEFEDSENSGSHAFHGDGDDFDNFTTTYLNAVFDSLDANPESSLMTIPENQNDSWLIVNDTENKTTYFSGYEMPPVFNSVVKEINTSQKLAFGENDDVYDVLLYAEDINSTLQYDYIDDIYSSCTKVTCDSCVLCPKCLNDTCSVTYMPGNEDFNDALMFIDTNKSTEPIDDIIIITD